MARSCFKYLIHSGFLQHRCTRDSRCHVSHCSSVNNGPSIPLSNKMFLQIVFNLLILLYFWYFYIISPTSTATSSEPTNPVAPDPPEPFSLEFIEPPNRNIFQYFVGPKLVWEHSFEGNPRIIVHGYLKKISEKNECYYFPNEVKVSAKGLGLYKYIQDHPDFQDSLAFKETQHSALQRGDIFYYVCRDRDIQSLHVCPSGTFFQNEICVPISSCTNKPNGFKLPFHSNIQKYVECINFKEFIKDCPRETFFYHDRCVKRKDLAYYCELYDTVMPLKLNDTTLFECLNRTPHYTRCEPGTKLFDRHICEPTDCVGQPDHARLPLPKKSRDPFHYIPGYVECFGNKVLRAVECPSVWDFSRTKGDNLTLLPMVFYGNECTIPTFCVNVFSDDPDVIVPVHEFTKHVQNWVWSDLYDRSAGYICSGGRKRKSVGEDHRISKRFKIEPACRPGLKLPMDQNRRQYYDCDLKQTVECVVGDFFDGKQCREIPENAFAYRGVPLFQFDSLNAESWMAPWDYAKNPPTVTCQPGHVLLSVYNVCAQEDCAKFPFLAMVPSLTLFLPRHQQSQCRFDEQDRHIKKEWVAYDYTFWNQRVLEENVRREDQCQFGQRLKTGNFIWDSTIYATCDPTQPFVFCPSAHTTELVSEGNVHACGPPSGNEIHHGEINAWTSYAKNEVKRLLSAESTDFHVNKREGLRQLAPDGEFYLPPNTTLTLHSNKPMKLELRYRVTLPPHVVFKYDEVTNDRTMVLGSLAQGFLTQKEGFTDRALNFPIYTPEAFVDGGLVE